MYGWQRKKLSGMSSLCPLCINVRANLEQRFTQRIPWKETRILCTAYDHKKIVILGIRELHNSKYLWPHQISTNQTHFIDALILTLTLTPCHPKSFSQLHKFIFNVSCILLYTIFQFGYLGKSDEYLMFYVLLMLLLIMEKFMKKNIR